MEAYIKAISYYLPEKVVTNDDLVKEFPEWTVDKIAGKVGVSERHIAAEDETAGDMAAKAAEMLFAEYGIDRTQIDFVILCTQSPDYFLPPTACLLQSRLGLSTKCGAFDIDLGCSGYEYGLAVAKGLIVSGIAKNILLMTAETYNKKIHPKDKGNRTIFGDAAAATLVSIEGFAQIGEFVLGTDGKGAEGLIENTGAFRQRNPANDLAFDENGNPHSSDHLFMDGKAIFDFTADVVPEMCQETIDKNGLQESDINLYVFHQANRYMINYLRKLMGIDKERFYVYLEKVGNTVSSTIPIALKEAQKEGKLNGNVLLAGFGVGLSYGATIIKL
ncbi:MAG: ketoacyl-ACP synthase III [Bacteroidaceae bacterium]|nr:ketoacyl-ACP synthase III [Bacteroidaceae bacterium]